MSSPQPTLPFGDSIEPQIRTVWVLAPGLDDLASSERSIERGDRFFILDERNASTAVLPGDVLLLAKNGQFQVYSEGPAGLETEILRKVNRALYQPTADCPRTLEALSLIQLSLSRNEAQDLTASISGKQGLAFYLARLKFADDATSAAVRIRLSQLLLTTFDDTISPALAALLLRLKGQALAAISGLQQPASEVPYLGAKDAYFESSRIFQNLSMRSHQRAVLLELEKLSRQNVIDFERQDLLPGVEWGSKDHTSPEPAFFARQVSAVSLSLSAPVRMTRRERTMRMKQIGVLPIDQSILKDRFLPLAWDGTDVSLTVRERADKLISIEILLGDDLPTRLGIKSVTRGLVAPMRDQSFAVTIEGGPNFFSGPHMLRRGVPSNVQVEADALPVSSTDMFRLNVIDASGRVQTFMRPLISR